MISYPFKYKKAHDAEALVLLCIDFRFHDSVNTFIKNELGIQTFDVLEIAGSGKGLNYPKEEHDFKTIIEQIGLSSKLHHVKKLFIVHHADCGAYGGRRNFKSVEAEKEKHIDEMLNVKKRLEDNYPDLGVEVIPVFMNLDEAQTKITPEVIN